eukprot:EG_transcript_26968
MGKGGLHAKLAKKREAEAAPAAPEVRPRKPAKRRKAGADEEGELSAVRVARPPATPGDGPAHFRQAGSLPNDEWQTAAESWQAISHWFAAWQAKRVWQPFYYDGRCAEYLRGLGFRDVVHEPQDFFRRVEDRAFTDTVDLIWDNPPYTTPGMKERILTALGRLGKPFALLLPANVLHSQLLHTALDVSRVQCIVPRRVLVRKEGQEAALPFKYLMWLCYDVGLPRD